MYVLTHCSKGIMPAKFAKVNCRKIYWKNRFHHYPCWISRNSEFSWIYIENTAESKRQCRWNLSCKAFKKDKLEKELAKCVFKLDIFLIWTWNQKNILMDHPWGVSFVWCAWCRCPSKELAEDTTWRGRPRCFFGVRCRIVYLYIVLFYLPRCSLSKLSNALQRMGR